MAHVALGLDSPCLSPWAPTNTWGSPSQYGSYDPGARLTLPLALGADLPQEHGDEEAAGRGSKKKMRGRREATGNDIEEAAGRGGKDKERRGAAGR